MNRSSIPGLRRLAGRCGALLALLWLSPDVAPATTFDLDVEFDTGQTGSFARVEVNEDAGALDFGIELTGALGDQADLHEFYFNLLGSFTGLSIATADAPLTSYTLAPNPSVRGGAGADFDWGVNFGNGAGSSGNGVLSLATFRLTADQPLSIAALVESSFASGGSIESQLAAHVQGTELFATSDSETVGGVVPEPATVLLVAVGFAGMSALRTRGRYSH